MTDTAPKPFVFVLMPFEASFDDIYKLGIKSAAEAAGAYCERIDEQIFGESILARIYNQIAKSDLLVADMTGRNPNVFYEVGYAHALNRTVILLTRNSEDIPFDLKHYPHIIYQGSISSLKEKLQARITHHFANPTSLVKSEQIPPDFHISGTRIAPGARIEISPVIEHREINLPIGITNPHEVVCDWTELSAGLILPAEFSPSYDFGAIRLNDGRYLYDLRTVGRLFPGEWKSCYIQLSTAVVSVSYGQEFKAELRLFTPTGPRSTAFSLTFAQRA